jgi:hypothetical protein
MTAEDAALAAKYGAKAIILSNHGGRQLEGSPSSLETLLEIRKFEPQVLDKIEVYVDGGVRRGTDVLKALALGATAVGLGRPCTFSSSPFRFFAADVSCVNLSQSCTPSLSATRDLSRSQLSCATNSRRTFVCLERLASTNSRRVWSMRRGLSGICTTDRTRVQWVWWRSCRGWGRSCRYWFLLDF